MYTPHLTKQLKKQHQRKTTSFHVPGHKSGRGIRPALAYCQATLEELDYTEIPELDNLHAPEGVLRMAQEEAAVFFGSRRTWFLVGGSTVGVQAMLLSATKPGDKVAVARNCHRSVHSACILGDIRPVYLQPERVPDLDLTLGITPEAVKKAFECHPDLNAVLVTSPTYEGIHSDLESIAAICHEHQACLLVDEAHGAHLSADTRLGIPAIQQGADAAVQSVHKTLGGLTQAALLHSASDWIDQQRVQQWLSVLQTSSPSYLILLSTEWAIAELSDKGAAMTNELLQNIQGFREDMSSIPGLHVLDQSDVQDKGFGHDPSRLVLFCSGAAELAEALRTHEGIEIEYATGSALVCVPTVWNTAGDFKQLSKALRKHCTEKEPFVGNGDPVYPKARLGASPRQAFYAEKRVVTLEQAVGRYSGDFVIPYPPGVPVLVPGELISREMVTNLQEQCRKGRHVMGIASGTIQVIDNDKETT